MPTESPTLTDAGVSVREAEVLDLVGEHLTNAEISARLFISVRTVESHVSSLLRKLDVADRRALAQFAVALSADAAPIAPGVPAPAASVLPAPLTSFVGRAAERAGLAAALAGQRLVTAVGPGGVGKTRLALAVASDLSGEYADGVWYVDLVPVTDPAMIPAAIAAALGESDQSARSIEETVLDRLAGAEALVVLDNCEHLVDSVVLFVERLLAACPRVTVLTTSRARLLVPFERVFPVGGLSLGADDGDAVRLFLDRAAAVGAAPMSDDELQRVAAVCAQLDGMALAIELAAARLPTLGLDGLEAGLGDQLGVLAGRARLDDRHSSLRAALDWSYALLEPAEQAILRRVSVFAAPFKADDAAQVVSFDPIDEGDVAPALAHLADQSLLVVLPDPSGTRYRALETIRQYGDAALDESHEHDAVHDRHLAWATAQGRALQQVSAQHAPAELPKAWRAGFDQIADDLRAAFGWAKKLPDRHPEAYELGLVLAELAFLRGLSGEAQRRFEHTATLACGAEATRAWKHAAGVAQIRQMGDDCLRLQKTIAEAALADGDIPTAARARIETSVIIDRCPGILGHVPSQAETDAYLAEGVRLAVQCPDDRHLEVDLLVAEAFHSAERDPATGLLAERAIELARRVGDPNLESAALDALTAVQLAGGDMQGAATSARTRADMLLLLPAVPDKAFELPDALQMVAECCIAIGDLRSARRYAERLRVLPYFGDDAHLALSRLLIVEALAGNWDRALDLSVPFRERWERAGSPATSNLAMGAAAVAMVHGLRGDDAARDDWGEMVRALRVALVRRYGERHRANHVFEATVPLHRGEPKEALELLPEAPEAFREWGSGRMRQWYAALWAEAAALAGDPSTPGRLARARYLTQGNPIAGAIAARAAVLADPAVDRRALLPLADALDVADCAYQAARTRVFAGGDAAEAGAAVLVAMGATPVVP